MIQYANGTRLVEASSELPEFGVVKDLFLDLETTSGDPQLDSLNPWQNCSTLGVCVTVDDAKGSWYVPVGHQFGKNVALEPTTRWISDLLKNCKRWINHNVKYDAHVLKNDLKLELNDEAEMVDTVTRAKLLDSDRITSGGYSLEALSRDWLDEDVSSYKDAFDRYLVKNKDYGAVPVDIMAPYGGQDAISVRDLWLNTERRLPAQCQSIAAIETKLTRVLFDIETAGLRVDLPQIRKKQHSTLHSMLALQEAIHKLTGAAMRPHVNNDCYDLLVTRYGLPVLAYTVKNGLITDSPSFDKEAMNSYLMHPDVLASQDLTLVCKLILEYRKLSTLDSLFLGPYQKLAVNSELHASYNQSVRTGRLSCGKPNMQQLSPEAKALILAREGTYFLSADYSQVEFRIIVHYLNNEAAVAAYLKDPDTDFHQWVADMCGIPRKPAKNINFAIGFGAGRKKILRMLRGNMELMHSLQAEAHDSREFDRLCFERARHVYETYHKTLPELAWLSRVASDAVKQKGYVFDAYGRHRHMPEQLAWRAFNNVIQGSAASLMKERMVATSPRFNPAIRAFGIRQLASVHDEILFEVPQAVTANDLIGNTMENTLVTFRVPIRVGLAKSARNWASCEEISFNRAA